MADSEHLRRAGGNRLLAVLPPDDLAALPLQEVHLPRGTLVLNAGDPVRYAFFPSCGVVSQVLLLEDGTAVEVATVGNEGFVEASALLSLAGSPFEVQCQTDVRALRMGIGHLREAFRTRPGVRDLLLRFAGVVLTCSGLSVGCSTAHTAEQRLARWLLMTRDRLADDDLPYTHEALGHMLGVRRPTISLAAKTLQDQGLIAYHRGAIRLLNRAGLEAVACEDYATFRDAYDRLLGPVGLPPSSGNVVYMSMT